MVDVSKFSLDTAVKIKILDPPGIWLPELETYTPVSSYASVENVISMLNRGIIVNFPTQSSQGEISNKIEEILLDYEERRQQLKPTKGEVGTNVDTALDTIQEMNDTITHKQDLETKRSNQNIFDNKDVDNRIVRNLSDIETQRIFDSDDYIDSDDRIKRAELDRIARENISKQREHLLKQLAEESKVFQKLALDGNYNEDSFKSIEGVNDLMDTATTNIRKK